MLNIIPPTWLASEHVIKLIDNRVPTEVSRVLRTHLVTVTSRGCIYMETKSKQLDDWNLPTDSVFTHSAQDSFRPRSPSTMACFASSFAVAFSWNTTPCSTTVLQCLKKIECTKNGHQWHETNSRFHPLGTFIYKPFPPSQSPQQITTLKVDDMQKSLSNSIGTSSSDVIFGHCSSSISLQCSKNIESVPNGTSVT